MDLTSERMEINAMNIMTTKCKEDFHLDSKTERIFLDIADG
jgi:hypothetical protein